MRFIKGLLAVALVGTPWLIGCTDSGHRSARDNGRDYRVSRNYDYGRYDRATEAGYGRGPWRDEGGRLHHPPGWKADSARGRLSNDRDDRFDRY